MNKHPSSTEPFQMFAVVVKATGRIAKQSIYEHKYFSQGAAEQVVRSLVGAFTLYRVEEITVTPKK